MRERKREKVPLSSLVKGLNVIVIRVHNGNHKLLLLAGMSDQWTHFVIAIVIISIATAVAACDIGWIGYDADVIAGVVVVAAGSGDIVRANLVIGWVGSNVEQYRWITALFFDAL